MVQLVSLAKSAVLKASTGSIILILAASCTTSSSPSLPGPQFSLSQINNSFSAMSVLKPLAAEGNGNIAVILPETVTAKRWVQFDAPYLKESFQKAGLKTSQYSVQIAPGSAQFSLAQAAISKGASVLILGTRDSGVGVRIESYAKAHGVPVIDYDYLTVGGARKYYVSFDSLKVGVLLGQGLVNCVSAWKVKKPQIIVMRGAPTDYNSALFARGYQAILAQQFSSGWKDVSNPPGTWDPLIAQSEFEQQYAADKNINAALVPNDENATPIIGYLQSKGIRARTFPITGQDAGPNALRNILAGYQCGTVYKPIYLEAQAAAALALFVRAKVAPPPSLLNGNIIDPLTGTAVASVLLTPEWVTTENMRSTVIADKFVSISFLCSGTYASACSAAGILG